MTHQILPNNSIPSLALSPENSSRTKNAGKRVVGYIWKAITFIPKNLFHLVKKVTNSVRNVFNKEVGSVQAPLTAR